MNLQEKPSLRDKVDWAIENAPIGGEADAAIAAMLDHMREEWRVVLVPREEAAADILRRAKALSPEANGTP